MVWRVRSCVRKIRRRSAEVSLPIFDSSFELSRRCDGRPRALVAICSVGGDHLVEDRQVASGNRPKRHDACAVHHHIDRAERVHRLLEETVDVRRVGHICLDRNRSPAGRGNFGDGLHGFGRVARVVHDDAEDVA